MNNDAQKVLLFLAWCSADLAIGYYRSGMECTAYRVWEASSKMLMEVYKPSQY